MSASHTRERPPSPQWLGVLFLVALFGSASWVLLYTLLSIRPLEALGGWNYLGALAVLTGAPIIVAAWRSQH